MLGYLSTNIIFSEKQKVFRERSSRKTVNFEKLGNIYSNDAFRPIARKRRKYLMGYKTGYIYSKEGSNAFQ